MLLLKFFNGVIGSQFIRQRIPVILIDIPVRLPIRVISEIPTLVSRGAFIFIRRYMWYIIIGGE